MFLTKPLLGDFGFPFCAPTRRFPFRVPTIYNDVGSHSRHCKSAFPPATYEVLSFFFVFANCFLPCVNLHSRLFEGPAFFLLVLSPSEPPKETNRFVLASDWSAEFPPHFFTLFSLYFKIRNSHLDFMSLCVLRRIW